MYDYGFRWYDPSIGRWNAVDPLAADFAAWSTYNYVLGNPIIFVDSDGRAPENIIITINASDKNSPGHAQVAIEQYDENGEKNGKVMVYNLRPAGEQPSKSNIYNDIGVPANTTGEEMTRSEFMKQAWEGYDGIQEITTTPGQDKASTARLNQAVAENADYNAVNNNCTTFACSALEGVIDTKDVGNETMSAGLMTRTSKVPNALFNDLKKIDGVETKADASEFTKIKFIEYVKNH